MASPISIISAVNSAITTGFRLYTLFEDMRSAPFDISELEKEISQLCPILQLIQDSYPGPNATGADRSAETSAIRSADGATSYLSSAEDRINRLREENEQNLGYVLMSCYEVLEGTAKLLKRYNPQRKNAQKKNAFIRQSDKFFWAVDGRGKADSLKKKLEASKSTLSIATGLIRQHKMETTGKQVDRVHEDTQMLRSQVRDVLSKLDKLDKEEVSSILAQAPSEHSFILRRYLESASTYAESALGRDEEGVSRAQSPRYSRGSIMMIPSLVERPISISPAPDLEREVGSRNHPTQHLESRRTRKQSDATPPSIVPTRANLSSHPTGTPRRVQTASDSRHYSHSTGRHPPMRAINEGDNIHESEVRNWQLPKHPSTPRAPINTEKSSPTTKPARSGYSNGPSRRLSTDSITSNTSINSTASSSLSSSSVSSAIASRPARIASQNSISTSDSESSNESGSSESFSRSPSSLPLIEHGLGRNSDSSGGPVRLHVQVTPDGKSVLVTRLR